jgi:hypothetical protein
MGRGPGDGGLGADARAAHGVGVSEEDLTGLRWNSALARLTLKGAPRLRSLSGVELLPQLSVLKIFAAKRLSDITDVRGVAGSLKELELEACAAIASIESLRALVALEFLSLSDCGDMETFEPIGALVGLRELHAWGTTRVADGDLTPIARLPKLRGLRMQDRRSYQPRVRDLGLTPP